MFPYVVALWVQRTLVLRINVPICGGTMGAESSIWVVWHLSHSQSFPPFSFWVLTVCKNEGGRLGRFCHMTVYWVRQRCREVPNWKNINFGECVLFSKQRAALYLDGSHPSLLVRSLSSMNSLNDTLRQQLTSLTTQRRVRGKLLNTISTMWIFSYSLHNLLPCYG